MFIVDKMIMKRHINIANTHSLSGGVVINKIGVPLKLVGAPQGA
jgi:hypothetical protein